MSQYTLGLDYGTNSVRALIVDVANGDEIADYTWIYAHGESGVVIDPKDPNLARQHPRDYLQGIEETVKGALASCQIDPAAIIGIGVDTTGSTPLPVDANGHALAESDAFAGNLTAMAWLWKDHTSHAEAAEITAAAASEHPEYLAKCGGTYSSEWFWAKLLRAVRDEPEVIAATASWVELADWVPAVLTGTTAPGQLKRGYCTAGHKAMFHPNWGGYPERGLLAKLHPELGRIRDTLPNQAHHIGEAVGGLTTEWAGRLGLQAGISVAVGAMDAHFGAVGSGVEPGTLVKIIGTSTCDIAVAPLEQDLPDIPGLCGIAVETVLPGCYGLEAGQSAVGDIFNWFVNKMDAGAHEHLTEDAEKIKPGESGLLTLDWHNGNRTILIDQRLTGLTLGMTLHTCPAEYYRSLIEATAFGARAIVERFKEYGVPVDRVINCGGISLKNPMAMQIYADVMQCPLEISRSTQTCALGAAIAGAVVAGAHQDFPAAMKAMTGVHETSFQPIPENVAVYDRLYALYKQVHDSFGTKDYAANQYNVMKDLLAIRDEVRG